VPLLIAVLLLLLVAAPAAAAERPIVYVVVIDGLDGDTVDEGKAPFISSLLAGADARATYFQESRSVIPAETNPNHTAMMTGAYTGASGIAANAFALYAPLENEDTCATTGPFDFTAPPTPTSGEAASCLEAETVFASVERQRAPGGLLTAAIFGKPKLGRIFAGSTVNAQRRDVDYLWAPCASGADDDDYCASVPTNPATGYALDDSIVMDAVIASAEQGVPDGAGGTRRPDFTFVNLPQVDSAGHATGRGPIYDGAVALADTQIRRLVTALRGRGEWERTVLMLVSDHSMDTTLSKVTVSDALTGAGVGSGEFVTVQNGSVDFVYLADRTSPQRFDLLKKMRAAVLAQGGVSEALYRQPNPADGDRAHTVDAVHPGWHAAGERTGDLIVISAPGTAFADPTSSSNPLIGNHGAPQTRDHFLAVTGGGDFVRQQSLAATADPLFDDTLANPQQSENVDLAPTVMGLFGLGAPRDNRGRFLAEAFEVGALPGAGRPQSRPRLKVRTRRRGSLCAYRLAWGPAGAHFDVQSRGRGDRRWRTMLGDTVRTRLRINDQRGRSFRVRLRSAAGVGGRFRTSKARCR
jgi:phosphonoacetate hydrolase